MALQVLLQGGNRKKWIAGIALLVVIVLGALEVRRPGTIATIPYLLVGAVVTFWGWLGDIVDALRLLIRDITGWYS